MLASRTIISLVITSQANKTISGRGRTTRSWSCTTWKEQTGGASTPPECSTGVHRKPFPTASSWVELFIFYGFRSIIGWCSMETLFLIYEGLHYSWQRTSLVTLFLFLGGGEILLSFAFKKCKQITGVTKIPVRISSGSWLNIWIGSRIG